MSYSVTIKLEFNRYDVGPMGPFDLYSNVDDFTEPFESCITRDQIDGTGYVSYLVPEGTQTIRIKTECSDCDTYVDVNLITPSPSPTPSVTPTISLTATPTLSVTPTITPSKTPQPTRTPTRTPSETPSLTPTVTPSATPSITATVTPTVTPSVTITKTPSISFTPTNTVTPSVTNSPLLSPTATPSVTPSISKTPSVTVTPTITPSITPSGPAQPIAGTRLANSSAESCYAPIVPVYTFDGQVLPGYTLYTNAQLTINVTGYNHVKLDNGIIYTLNSVTGVVGNDTGNRCSGNVKA